MTDSPDKRRSACPPTAQPIIALPVAPVLRGLIDEALNAVMEEAAGNACLSLGTLGRCADYAIVGARVLSKLSDHPHVAVAGGEIIDCGNGMYIVLFPTRSARRHARKLSDLKDYHCWIQSVHATPDGKERLEWIDFTIRHDPLVAKMFGILYSNPRKGDYLWDWYDSVPEVPADIRPQLSVNGNCGDWMWTDAICMRLLHKYEQEHDVLLNDLVARVLHRLADMVGVQRKS
ncbi:MULTISPECIES: hypothetical protein [unclassified Herbaspirillum]|uniref:hypothetical protein n=1 Tax=unclassified Herbaspirillum TaxID=2624150 RepID=UPI00383B11E8